MKTKRASVQGEMAAGPHPLWMRLLTFVCMALLAVVSTVQVCHSHDDFRGQDPTASLSVPAGQASIQVAVPKSPATDTTSVVNCPLCVAMHSALPVTHSLVRVEALRTTQQVIVMESAKRLFLWRFQLASRPPPAPGTIA